MDYSSLRAEARKRLAGKWGKVIAVLIVTGLLVGLITWIPSLAKTKETISYYGFYSYTISKDNIVSVLLTLVAEVVSLVFSFGLIAALWKVYNGEDIKATSGITLTVANWKRALSILINVLKKLLIPVIMIVAAMILNVIITNTVVSVICSILSIVGGIWLLIAGLHYALIFTIAADNPNMSESAVVEKSKELMTNRRGKYVVLSLTFIGWCILGVLSLGIGMLWVTPYMQFATFAFYEFCKRGNTTTPEVKEEPKEEGPIQEQ